LDKDSEDTKRVLEQLKMLEHEGYQFETAESSLHLLLRKLLGKHKPLFELREYRVNICEPAVDGVNSSATIRLAVDGQETETTANGDGPVNALDKALRQALEEFFPAIADIKLTDYKVRVLDSDQASAAKVRVL